MSYKVIKRFILLLTVLLTLGTFCASDTLPDEIEQSYWQCNWEKYDDAAKKWQVQKLADSVAESLNIKVPEIRYFRDKEEEMAYYDYGKNQIYINENNLFSAQYTFTSICHELRHVWQYNRTKSPETEADFKYKQNFANYISSDGQSYSSYSSQFIEQDAEMYANTLYTQLIKNANQG